MNHGAYRMYNQIDINTSNPLKIVLMMYDGSINFLKKAVEYGENKDIKNKNIYVNKARDIILELNNALNMEASEEIAGSLRKLYFFMNRRLIEASWSDNAKGLIEEVAQLLSNLKEGWQDAYNQQAGVDSRPQIPNERISSLRYSA